MGRYLIRRALFMILVLFVVSFLTFFIFIKLPPGDPAVQFAGRRRTEETVAQVRKNLGLDQPWYVQYGRFAKGLVPWPGWFLNEKVYFSYSNNVAVKEEIYPRLPYTITVAVGAAVIWLAVGIPIGIVSAIKRRSLSDRAGMMFALFGVSMPVPWLAYLFLFFFWYKLSQLTESLGWPLLLPGSSIPADESLLQSVMARRFVLPWLVLCLAFAAFYSRMTRGNLFETMGEDYIRTARAKGLSERKVIFKHGLRSALTPIITMFGIDMGFLLGGAVITETVFNIPGLGQYLVQGITTNDFPAVMGVTVVAAMFIVVMNLVVDVMYALLDPRVRYE